MDKWPDRICQNHCQEALAFMATTRNGMMEKSYKAILPQHCLCSKTHAQHHLLGRVEPDPGGCSKLAWTFVLCNQGLFYGKNLCWSLCNVLHNKYFSRWYSFEVLAVLIEHMLGFDLEVLHIVQGERESMTHSSGRDRSCKQPAYSFLYKYNYKILSS